MKTTLFALLFQLFVFSGNLLSQEGTPSGLKLGDLAPQINAIDENGKSFDLHLQLKKSAVLLVFYRGEWCGYCNKYMQALQDSISLLKAKNITVIAVTPEKRANADKMAEKSHASFHILVDSTQDIMSRYKTKFTLTDEMITKYKGYGINLPEVNVVPEWSLPVPATYLIKQDGTIGFVHFDPAYSNRASIKDVLAVEL